MEQGRFLVGIMVSESSKKDGLYHFKYGGSPISVDSNILYITTEEELSDEELTKRFNGTKGFEKIIRK